PDQAGVGLDPFWSKEARVLDRVHTRGEGDGQSLGAVHVCCHGEPVVPRDGDGLAHLVQTELERPWWRGAAGKQTTGDHDLYDVRAGFSIAPHGLAEACGVGDGATALPAMSGRAG